jgi:hypothetical protein
MMIFEITNQVRVTNFNEGCKWYEVLLNKAPDFMPHDGFAEWEIIPGFWLQVAEGTPAEGSGPLRFGVTDIIAERNRLVKLLRIDPFEIHGREEVPARWGTFTDPWGNKIGLFEYVNKKEEQARLQSILSR